MKPDLIVGVMKGGSLNFLYPSPLRGGIGRLWRPSLRDAEAKLRLWRVKRASGWGCWKNPHTLAFASLWPSLPARGREKNAHLDRVV